jgi:hypothetical protein
MNTHTNQRLHKIWYSHSLFIYGLLHSALHISDYTAQNGEMNDA